MKTFSPGRFLFTIFLFTSISSAWPWPPSLQHFDGLLQRRQESDSKSNNSPAETAKAQATKADNAAKTAASTAAASETADATSENAAKTGSGATKATQSGAKKTSAAATKTQSINPVLPPGGVNMVTPSALAQTSYYKIGDYVSLGWNFTSLSIKPAKIDAYVTCGSNEGSYAILNNATYEPTMHVVWDTKPDATGTAPLLTETYTLVIKDASKDVTAAAQAGRLGTAQQFVFGMYKPQAYTPLSEGWKCATCSGAMSSIDLHALKFMLGMCMVTILSFTWFAGGFGTFF